MDSRTRRVKAILAANIKKYRKKSGFSQKDAALSAGISLKYWQRLEMSSQTDFPSFPMLLQVAESLKTTMSNLLKE